MQKEDFKVGRTVERTIRLHKILPKLSKDEMDIIINSIKRYNQGSEDYHISRDDKIDQFLIVPRKKRDGPGTYCY